MTVASEYLVTIEDKQYEMAIDDMLRASMNGDDSLIYAEKHLYTGVKDIKGNKIYDDDVVSEVGHYVNSDRITYQIVNFAPNHGAWLRGKYQRLTPKNVKQYQITVMPRKTEFFSVPEEGHYLVAFEKDKIGEVEYYREKAMIPNPVRVNKISYEEAMKRQKDKS